MLNETQIGDIWLNFVEYLDKNYKTYKISQLNLFKKKNILTDDELKTNISYVLANVAEIIPKHISIVEKIDSNMKRTKIPGINREKMRLLLLNNAGNVFQQKIIDIP
jgi:hypothetical protein